MTQVETVAMWIGLAAGFSGTILAIVAMAFTYVVNKRSEEINSQSIESLQKIETRVEQVSSDTRNLIKTGWEALLPGPGSPQSIGGGDSGLSARESSGFIAEIREALSGEVSDLKEELSERIENWETALDVAMQRGGQQHGVAHEVDQEIGILRALPKEALALAYLLRSHHISSDSLYELDMGTALSPAIDALRKEALLVPLSGRSPTGDPELVFWFPEKRARAVQGALALIRDEIPPDAELEVRDLLRRVGYSADTYQ